MLVDLVGGEDDGATFVALADDLEEQVGAVFVDGQVAELVDQQDSGLEILAQFPLSPPAAWAAERVLMMSMAVVKSTE